MRKRGNRWTASVYDPKTRKRVWVGTFDTKAEARDAEYAAAKTAKRKTRLTVKEFAGTWTENYPRKKASTNKLYDELTRQFVRDFGGRQLDDVSRAEARAWALKHRAAARVVRTMYSDALRDELTERNPFLDLRLVDSRGRKDLVVPTAEEIDKLVVLAGRTWDTYGRKVIGPLITIAAYTGLRPGELFGLRWGDVDYQAATLLVERQYNAKVSQWTTPKNGFARTVYLTPPAAKAFRQVPALREEIFTTAQGKHLTGRTSHYYWHPVRCAMNRPDLELYSLRHYFGTYLANLGVGPVEIAQAMGHRDGGKLAMDRYIHMTEKDAREKIARAFGANVQRIGLREASGE